VEETINLLRTLAKSEVEFEVRLPADLPALLADPGQVHQVLMNIGTNAVQAMRGGRGRLSFQAETVEVGSELRAQFPELQPGNHVRITVRDTGPGMTLEVQQRVFEPFFTTKAAGEGTGLGLSVVHGIMQQHGGAVTLHSQPGQGSQFQLYFRAAAGAARPDADSANGLVPHGNGERVLFVATT
jgi:two-component system, cell cycle sensor histidine kinase and response regulator CckA